MLRYDGVLLKSEFLFLLSGKRVLVGCAALCEAGFCVIQVVVFGVLINL